MPDRFQNHDRRIPDLFANGYQDYGIGLLKVSCGTGIRSRLDIPGGLCSTGESVFASDLEEKHFSTKSTEDENLNTYAKNGHPVVKDMDTAAVGWVCKVLKKKFMVLKVISNVAPAGDDDVIIPQVKQYKKNQGTTAKVLK